MEGCKNNFYPNIHLWEAEDDGEVHKCGQQGGGERRKKMQKLPRQGHKLSSRISLESSPWTQSQPVLLALIGSFKSDKDDFVMYARNVLKM